MMHIKSVEFAGAIGQVGQAAPASVAGLPQIAFSGRSNVGKSSLINRLLGRTRSPIARVSATPGKTQEVNFFTVRSDVGTFILVDLPGYGFASAPKPLREKWAQVIESYLANARALTGVVQLIDIRHGPTADDEASIDYLARIELPVLFVLTKADKLRFQKRMEAVKNISRQLGVDDAQVIPFSVLSGEGVEELQGALESLIERAAEAGPPPVEVGEAEEFGSGGS